jgi:hypothetical protein
MRNLLWSILVGTALSLVPVSPARAQAPGSAAAAPVASSPAPAASASGSYFGTPGNYFVSWGVPSFGWPRTYSVFSSPYGAGYGYGYYPYMTVPGYYGFRLYRAGYIAEPNLYGGGIYSTPGSFAPFLPVTLQIRPPLGYYAPGLGAPAFYSW